MGNVQVDMSVFRFDVDAIDKEYRHHASRSQQVAEQINRWGKFTWTNLQSLYGKEGRT